MPSGYRIAPHTHPTDENVTVISGTFLVGMGEKIDTKNMMTLTRRRFRDGAGEGAHFAEAQGPTIVQVHAIGPFAMTYVNPADTPQREVDSTAGALSRARRCYQLPPGDHSPHDATSTCSGSLWLVRERRSTGGHRFGVECGARSRLRQRRWSGLWGELLERLPSMPVGGRATAAEVRAAVTRPVPAEPLSSEELIATLRTITFEHATYTGHSGFMAYITGAGTVPGAAADLVAAALNQNVGGWRLSPAATEIELHLGRWFATRLGLPERPADT